MPVPVPIAARGSRESQLRWKEQQSRRKGKGSATYTVEAIATLRGLLAREIAEAIVLGLGVAALVVVEG